MYRRKVLITIFSIVTITIVFAFFLARFARQNYCLPIIMYHSVSPDAQAQNRLSTSVDTFERQMRFLKNHRYNVLPLESLPDLIKNKKKIPNKTIAITLDDGYKDNYTFAFPILKKYNLPATMFIIVNEVNRPQNDRLSWKEIKMMQDSGLVTFGSHCLGPEPLVNIKSEENLKREILDSKKILEEKLARQITLFSYPEGRFNDKIRKLVIAAGYKLAVATSPGRQYPNNDIFVLKRLRISETARNMFVFWIQTSGFYTFIKEHRDN